ncbi:hypothetical protein BJY52DRAFT_1210738 [Lactarius psammicola]|nr:hypothetical protein BJY52DRAFT_1210738 [Lactarius psammicola]
MEIDDQQHIQYLREGTVRGGEMRAYSYSLFLLAAGYSRELPGNTHAEANALEKARGLSSKELSDMFPNAAPNIDDVLMHTDVYTTLEPCSVRTSGLAPCADALVAARVPRCFIGAGEPDDFVQCTGAQKLKAVGCQTIWLQRARRGVFNGREEGTSGVTFDEPAFRLL